MGFFPIQRDHRNIDLVYFENNPKNLDPSCKMDLDFWDGFWKVKILCYMLKDYSSHKKKKQSKKL